LLDCAEDHRRGALDWPVVATHCARQARSTARGQLWAQAAALDTATLFGGFRINPVTGARVTRPPWPGGRLAASRSP